MEEPALPSLFAGTDIDREISPGALFTLLARRRSERRFCDRPVSVEAVSALLAAAAQIPSGGNARTVECKVLADNNVRRGLLASIRGFYHRLLRIAHSRFARVVAGALLGKAAGAFLKDAEYRRRFVALVEAIDGGIDPVFYGAPLVLLFHSKAMMPTPEEDAVLAAYNVALVAATLGLGSCFVSMAQKALSASRAVRRASGLAKDQRVLAVLAVGHPAVSRRRPVFRPSVPVESLEAGV
jgi:nitroreductase